MKSGNSNEVLERALVDTVHSWIAGLLQKGNIKIAKWEIKEAAIFLKCVQNAGFYRYICETFDSSKVMRIDASVVIAVNCTANMNTLRNMRVCLVLVNVSQHQNIHVEAIRQQKSCVIATSDANISISNLPIGIYVRVCYPHTQTHTHTCRFKRNGHAIHAKT